MPPPRDPRQALLARYRVKRSADQSPEPFGLAVERPRLFVVQKHAATRLHYDFRLECGGVLWSWAIPKGPSSDPEEKRLAVQVEDHPLEYADFEGIIPEGNYGAGPVVVWDRGVWVPYGDPEEGLATGRLHFELKGYKLHGVWTLVRIKGAAKEWLLIKKKDAFAASDQRFDEASILSGLAVEEWTKRSRREQAIRRALTGAGTPRRRVNAAAVKIMLAETASAPFSRAGWLFEVKYDGFRLVASKAGEEVRLFYRSGLDATATFPEIARALAALPCERFILDGEVVVLDERGRPDFQALQARGQLTRSADRECAAISRPATFFGFDLLAVGDFDVRGLPLVERKHHLASLMPTLGPCRYCDHIAERGEAMFKEAVKLGLEGIIAKRADAPYRPGRSPSWLKITVEPHGDFVVVGFTEPKGSRAGVGALHLAHYARGELVYAGRVGSGLADQQRVDLRRRLASLRQARPACRRAPKDRASHWVAPKLVCEVRYKMWTREGSLRLPVFVRLRDDKAPQDCVVGGRKEPEVAAPPVQPPQVKLTHVDKLFWPEDGFSKGDLIAYYRAVAPWLLPYLKDRPVVLTRYPDGIHGKSFFQKDAPGFVPDWVRTERMWSEHAQREIDYFICESEEALVYLANLGTIPLHIWSSRVTSLARPDWSILDLDPKGAPFAHVVHIARAIQALCRAIQLPAYVKTSGSTGLHVLIPLGGQLIYEQSRQLAQLVGEIIARELPHLATVARSVRARDGRVYIDCLQNGHGKLLVAPFSLRALAKAPVSTPLAWREVGRRLAIPQLNLKTVPPRMRRLGVDPVARVLTDRPDLSAALKKLLQRLEG